MTLGDFVISFFVPGVPIAQGSKDKLGRESSAERLKPWRASVVELAPELVAPVVGPVAVRADFYFMRPRAHYRGGRFSTELRTNAPGWHTKMPDLDKLQRAIGDAIAGVLIVNDSQIARWTAQKKYADKPGAYIELTSLTMEMIRRAA